MSVRVWQGTEETINDTVGDRTIDQGWHAQGSELQATIIAAAALVIPSAALGLYAQNITYTHKGGGFWDLSVRYAKPIVLAAGQFTLSGKTNGQTVHREQSLERIHWYSAGGIDQDDVPTYNGLIGVTKDGIAGVDTLGPGSSFTITKKFNLAALPSGFLQAIFDKKAHANNAPLTLVWKGQTFSFSVGELLLSDLAFNDDGRDKDESELVTVVYDLVYSPNVTGLTIGDIENIDKLGHEYLWVSIQETEENGWITRTPLAVYVERVYDYEDFSSMGL